MSESPFEISKPAGMPVADQELIDDLKRVAMKLEKDSIGLREYESHGDYAYSTIQRRFGSWNKALDKAGLSVSKTVNITDEELFENILNLWQHLGKQPRKRDLSRPPSFYSERPYSRRFGTWWKALEAFVEFANGTGETAPVIPESPETKNQGARDPNLRLRWKVLHRDRFTCQACGRSPASNPNVELHVDHKVPWSRGGKTELENLQSLCSSCNQGKSNL